MSTRAYLRRMRDELGITTLARSSKDVYLLLITRFIRMFAYGSSTLILAIYFAALGHSDTKIGLFMTLTLVGDVLVSLALTFIADGLGRRRILILGATMMAFSGIVFALSENYWILLFAAVVGVISPSGNEIGPFRAVEESTLAHLSEAKTRSDVFAWYIVIGTLGTAGGSLTCGWVTQGLQTAGWSKIASFKFIFWIYALIGLVKAGVSLLLSPMCEAASSSSQPPAQPPTPSRSAPGVDNGEEGDSDAEGEEEHEPFLGENQPSSTKPTAGPPPTPSTTNKSKFAISQISRKSRQTLLKLCGLFFFDSLASGMVPFSLIAFFMERKFGMPEGNLGTVLSIAQFVSSVGNIFASSVAKRIGLVRAMVFTHLPSAIFLALLPAPSSLLFTIILLVARASLSSMDQAPRSAFLAAVVRPEERTAVMGIVNTVKTMSQSSGPLITGVLAGGNLFWVAFVVAGSLKGLYDLGMLAVFVNMKLEGDDSSGGSRQGRRENERLDRESHSLREFELADDEDDEEDEEEEAGERELDELEPRSIGK